MPHWLQHAEDSFCLPEGFKRIGYDADTMCYTFIDKHGKLYQSGPGEEYDRLEAFSDRESLKPVESMSPTPKLTFSDFLPLSAMTSTTLSLDYHVPAPLPNMYLTGTSLHRTIMSMYAKGSANHVSHSPPPPHEGGMGLTSSKTSSVDTSVDKSKSSATEPKA
ncbi:hypothetical protein ARMGADRAFT_1036388 [Armillaria gallica]|uniref:Uncharacterized protein n=1 Tax=Armillaria gallica TaxID=47427 RepID=A0A2H3CQJ4_ARMGA|nr:hypothetical protein ARMGADRAFT_1036388 [Armillaria gallica]